MTTRQAAAFAIVAVSLSLATACSVSSDYGPISSAYFDQTVEDSLGDLSGGEIHEALRSNWLPYKKTKSHRGGIFAVTSRGLIFASWSDPEGRYRSKYRVAYNRLNTIRLHEDGFEKKLRVQTQSGRIDYFEILTQSNKPPYVVNNDLTEDIFELLKIVKRGHSAKQRRRGQNTIDFQEVERQKPRKPRASQKKRRKPRGYDRYDY